MRDSRTTSPKLEGTPGAIINCILNAVAEPFEDDRQQKLARETVDLLA